MALDWEYIYEEKEFSLMDKCNADLGLALVDGFPIEKSGLFRKYWFKAYQKGKNDRK
jgi:hypothetical protein